MKIAFFTETYLPYMNGVATQTEMLKRTYENLGHEVLVVTVGSEKQDDIIYKNNVMYMPGILLKKIYNYRISKPLKINDLDIAIKFNPDIIHIQNEFGIGHAGIKLAKYLDIPFVYTLHSEYDEFLFYVGLKYFNDFSKKISDNYFKKFSKYADVVTSPSKKAQPYLDRQNINKKVIVIDNTVENDAFKPTDEKIEFRKKFREEYKLYDETKAFVFVGRIGVEKNIIELVQNFIYSDFPKEKAKLFIIGAGPDSENIKKLINDNDFSDRIHYLGPKPNSEVPKYLYAMDYYTTASLSEMHSISMLEGMAAGLPAIIKLDVPNKEQIIPGINGYQWTDKEDFKELFNKIINLNSEQEKALKQNTLNYIEKNNNIAQAKKLLNIYEECIEKRKEKDKK